MMEAGRPIALVTPRYAPAIGGVERCVEMLARGLVARGQAVEVITTDPTGRLPPVEERAEVLVRRFHTVGHDGVYFLAPALATWLLRDAHRFSLIHAHSYHTPVALSAAVASRIEHVPLVLSTYYHGAGHAPVRRWLHRPYRPFGRWLLHQARRVLCISEAERRLLHQHFGPALPTVVIPCGVRVDLEESDRPRPASDGRVCVLAVGRLDAYKQIERLIAAVPRLPPAYEVVVIGDGPARPALVRLAERIAVGHRVRLLGWLPEQELLSWYRRADVLASLSSQESFGLTLLEAGAAGCPVVASDIPAHREIAQYFPDGRIRFLAVTSSPEEIARVVTMAAEAERFQPVEPRALPTWTGMVDGILACYRAVREASGSALREVVA